MVVEARIPTGIDNTKRSKTLTKLDEPVHAQGREDPNQNTGISIINCKVAAAADLIPVKSEFRNYLGRPWKMYSRTVFLNSLMEDLIDPVGCSQLDDTFALKTLYYGEYNNTGPGVNTSRKVTWSSYRFITNSTTQPTSSLQISFKANNG
ncbi:pectinesterase-like [Vigna umbellata]|uniref:pectinesterase-like n=1 Tax=Vigna umbellata TaxID=87088 RepID=UPI001F5E85B8|nr:pectinesterase-like [Vigna umbellata]